MKLSIITVNKNNVEGLRRTLESVAAQTYRDIEHIIVDGASTDGSVDVIKEYAQTSTTIHWVSEPDNGIYHAMNKGIQMVTGDYLQFLNSGDELATPDVTERMIKGITTSPEILYGNMIKKDVTTGKIILKSGEIESSMLSFYRGTLNHSCCYIRRDLFKRFGLYDESLKIVSDWKWFLQVIGLGTVRPTYTDIDVTVFDAGGISETNLTLRNEERRKVLEELLPQAVLADYDAHAFDAEQMNRLRRHHLYGLVYFLERILFKFEKWHVRKSNKHHA